MYKLHGKFRGLTGWNHVKNKTLTILCIGFSLFFLIFVFRITNDITNLKINLLKSPNVIDVTKAITTKLKISNEDLSTNGNWTDISYNDQNWKEVEIPSHQLVKEPEYEIGRYAYYRIFIPKEAFQRISHLKHESALSLYYIHFKQIDIFVNGKVYESIKPKNAIESVTLIPLRENVDNVVSIKGHIITGSSGIDHRDPIMLGRTAELSELYRASYKGMTVFPLIFILTKGSILFIFALIYLLLNVDRSFEKFLFFGLCTVVEELITGDYLYGPLNFNQMLYLYNVVNIGAVCSVFMFFSDLLHVERHKTKLKILALVLIFISFGLAIDSLYWTVIVDITKFMKFWNIIMVGVMLYFLPRMFRKEKTLFIVICASISLYLWSALFSGNVGFNMKAYGNLLLFFMVGYQTFAMFRREQIQLQIQERKLLEQEKDVAIGQTAKLLAHDVRRPMDLMHILLDKISSGDISNDFIDSAKRDIEFSIANVSHQVSDIISFSKNSKVDLHETSFYNILAASIRQVMSIHDGMDLDLQYNFNSKSKVYADESRLAGALVNLITNAVEAIKDIGRSQKGVIRFATELKGNDFVFRIFNDGPKIPETVIQNIFKPLFSYGKPKGTGLGLSSVMKAVKDLQGSIKVENTPSGGVEFALSLKASKVQDNIDFNVFKTTSHDYGYAIENSKNINDKRKFRLFLLEDEGNAVQYIQHLITQLPFEVSLTVANDYETAVEATQKQRYDLYVLDYDLGESKTGFDFYVENLNFLSEEVILHASRDLYDTDVLGLKFYNKPISLYDLTQVCESVYPKRLKILFVDDTKLFRIAWSSFHGAHNIVTASSPEEALKLVEDKSLHIDLCVLDFNYENSALNGEMLARKIRELRKDVRVMISSSIEQETPGISTISKRDYEVRKLK